MSYLSPGEGGQEEGEPDSENFNSHNFTLTENSDALLEELAQRHHEGNRSKAVRAAIEWYSKRDEYGNHYDVKEVHARIESVESSVESLCEALENRSLLKEVLKEIHQIEPSEKRSGEPEEDRSERSKQAVFDAVKTASAPMASEKIVESTDLTRQKVDIAIASLEGDGTLCRESVDGTVKYSAESSD